MRLKAETRRLTWSVDPRRAGKKDWIVEYSVDGVRGYFLSIPEEEYSEEWVREELVKEGKALAALQKIEVEVYGICHLRFCPPQ